ncbi:hypothetical protein EMPS_11017 [Entomortierella parvispora]|uniref:GDP-fucose protein O-fucosyltransferase n=1 Tax=Entomortierella parvispora TaxID=205924 RepID=A0A9P3HLE7_9FUNG|nr:hypothetical protein EMPS_11017 [Entomortierella parvispora]
MTASSPLFQKSRTHSDEYESLPQHRDDVSNGLSQHHPHSHSKRSRLTVARAVVLICIGSMLLALVHIHYTNLFRHERESAAAAVAAATESSMKTTPGNSNDLNDSHEEKVDTPPVVTKPETTKNNTTNIPTPPKNINKDTPTTPTTTDNALTTTVRYDNGTYVKSFKPAFFQDATEARKELGSFLETLEHRTWWNSDSKEPALQPGTPPTNTFFSYLPMGGGNNQFTSLQKAALLAKDLGRTLIIPPIAPSSHIKLWSGPRYSEFFDLQSFSAQSKIPILEWHDVKHTPEDGPSSFTHNWHDFAEEFPCIPNGGIGANDRLYDHFRPQFLMNHTVPKDVVDKTNGKSTDYVYARDVLLKDSKEADGKRDMWKCLTCPYFLNGGDLNDRAWKEIGLHLKFNNKIEKMADDILDLLLKPKDKKQLEASGRRHPEFIIIHLRRGDIVNKCKPNQPEAECIVQIEEIAEKVDAIEKQRRIQALSKEDQEANAVFERLPVLVTTNEKRKEELEKLEKLGWIMLDHGDEEKDAAGRVLPSKTIKLGTMSALGQFYPPMLDAVLLTRGDYLIGMSNSRMSQLAAQRGAAWHQHTTMLM